MNMDEEYQRRERERQQEEERRRETLAREQRARQEAEQRARQAPEQREYESRIRGYGNHGLMSATLVPANHNRDVPDRATTFEASKAELSALVDEDPWAAKLNSFAELASGWDGYEAEPPASSVVAAAKRFLGSTNLTPSRVAPSVVGGVGITFKRNEKKAYLELTNVGPVSLLLSDGVSDPHAQPVAVDDPALPTKIREYLGE